TRPLEARRSYSGQGVGDERRDDRPAFKSSASGDTRHETTSRGTRNPAPRAGSDVRGLARTATGWHGNGPRGALRGCEPWQLRAQPRSDRYRQWLDRVRTADRARKYVDRGDPGSNPARPAVLPSSVGCRQWRRVFERNDDPILSQEWH